MRYLSEAQTKDLLDENLALEAARAAFIRTGRTFPVVIGYGARDGERFTLKSGSTDDLTGVKIGSYWPGNDMRGIPRHGSTIVLLDPGTGRLDAVVEAAAGNALRTAAADALAVETLARPDANTLAVIGTGHQAFYEAIAIAHVRPITTILVTGRSEEKAATLAKRISERSGLSTRAATMREAVEKADVIATATTSPVALFRSEWVRPGTHISAMGTDGPGKQEIPVDLYTHARLFCDTISQSRSIGEFQHAPADAPLTPLGDVLRGTAVGRAHLDEVTVFDSSGIALQDLALAQALLDAHDDGNRA